MNRLICSSVLLATLTAAGCNGGTADVSGKVTYKGKPVVYGTVVLVGADGTPKSGAIQPDGTFRVSGIAVGTARVAVTSPPPPGSDAGGAKKPRVGRDAGDKPPADEGQSAPPEVIKNWVELPEKFGDPAKSEITVTVKAGQPADIELK